jgi:hypothetical protein
MGRSKAASSPLKFVAAGQSLIKRDVRPDPLAVEIDDEEALKLRQLQKKEKELEINYYW